MEAKEYSVSIIETLQHIVKVKATSESMAVKLAEEKYRAGEVLLDASDYVECEFKCRKPLPELSR